ncbi:MAG TPA: hypothetical protein VF103_02640 [Polyangiaceae bacterium]
MALRARLSVLAGLVAAATVVWTAGCSGDDCVQCCLCTNDNSPLEYRPGGTCGTCQEQCQTLADREFMHQPFDHADEIDCPD